MLFDAWNAGGFPMYLVLANGALLVTACARYAQDTEAVRLRFVTVVSIVLLTVLVSATGLDVVRTLDGLAAAATEGDRAVAWADGVAAAVNQWTLGSLLLCVAMITLAAGAWRAQRRELLAA